MVDLPGKRGENKVDVNKLVFESVECEQSSWRGFKKSFGLFL